ncbi:hypothetical protein PG984_006793 [Apiospora sp. TS-2023a]
MQASGTDQWMVDSLRDAVAEFKGRLECPDKIDFDNAQSIDDVYKETARIQDLQSRTTTLRASKRLKPYLNFLTQYETTIEVFVQVKPDILALIWGPLKLILRFASNLTKAFDKTLEVLENAGKILPDLHAWASAFPANPRVRKVLCLFYQDILDLHLAFLNLYGRKKWDLFFEAFWPRTTDLLTQIQGRMNKHKSLLTDEVSLENIIQARDARQHENEEYRRAREREDRQLFHGLLADLKINLYDSQVETLHRPSPAPLNGWLLDNEVFKRWSCAPDKKSSSLWLQGIPGAGKTVLCAKISEYLRKSGHTVLFAFLTYLDPDQGRPLKVFQSLIFQLLSEKPSLQPLIRDAHVHNHRKLFGSEEFATELFLNLVKDQGMIHIVVDGLDEAIEDSRLSLAKSLMQITTACQNVRLLVSCRNDPLLDKELRQCQQKLRVDHHNEPDISAYLDSEELLLVDQWRDLGADDSVLAEAKAGKNFIADHAKGMMLYAKLMMEILKSLDNPDAIHDELRGLPDGLDQAYARILERIKNSPTRMSVAAVQVLQWLTCASESLPLRVNEILQAMVVEKDADDFRTTRKALRDLRQTCGPIIDVDGDQVRLVHFSAKEYISRGQGQLLNIVDSNQEIASTILTYLSFDSFQSIFSEPWDEEEVKLKIKSQDFILFEYASRQWLSHIRGGCTVTTKTLPQHLIDALSKFTNRCQNENYQSSTNIVVHPRYRGLDEFPCFQSVVAKAEAYRRQCHVGLVEQDTEAATCIDNDPTLVSRAHFRFRRCLESLLCHGSTHEDGCACQRLEESYGIQLFKCDIFLCPYYNQGFSTFQEQQKHLATHSRPYKCTELGCLFAKLGLQTSRDLQLHIDSHHKNRMNNPAISSSTVDLTGISDTKWVLIVTDAIQRDDLELIRTFEYSKSRKEISSVVYFAAEYGSRDALQVVWKGCKDVTSQNLPSLNTVTAAAVTSGNIGPLQFCLAEDFDTATLKDTTADRTPLGRAIRAGNAQVIECFLQKGVKDSHLDYRRPSSFRGYGSFGLFKLQGTQLEECMAVFQRHEIPASMRQYMFACAVDMNALQLAKAFIQIGVKVNDASVPSTTRSFKSMKPLEIAVSKGLPDMVAFLLQNGAELDANGIKRNKAAIQRTERKMGMSWTEIVEQYGI